jgi:hypothetical protein
MKMKTMNSVGLIAIGALFLTGKASALTETYSELYSGLTTANPSVVLPLDYFNPSAGTLTGVTVTLTSVDTISATVVNASIFTDPVNIGYTAVSATADVTVTSLTPSLSATTMGSASYGSGTAVPGRTVLPPQTTAPVSDSYSPAPAGLAAFEGPSFFDVTVAHGQITGSGSSSDRNADELSYGGTYSSSGSVMITYTYTAPASVPDGGLTAGLLGAALVGVGALRRKLLV